MQPAARAFHGKKHACGAGKQASDQWWQNQCPGGSRCLQPATRNPWAVHININIEHRIIAATCSPAPLPAPCSLLHLSPTPCPPLPGSPAQRRVSVRSAQSARRTAHTAHHCAQRTAQSAQRTPPGGKRWGEQGSPASAGLHVLIRRSPRATAHSAHNSRGWGAPRAHLQQA